MDDHQKHEIDCLIYKVSQCPEHMTWEEFEKLFLNDQEKAGDAVPGESPNGVL